jgi:hypothetical protein
MHFSFSALARQHGKVDQNVYSNNFVGLSFSKPQEWHFIPEIELYSLPDSQKYALDDDEVIDEIFMEIGLPLVGINSSESLSETAPQADVWVQNSEGEESDVVETQTETFVGLYDHLLKNFVFETPPTATNFCGHFASVCTSRFLYEGSSGHSAFVRVRSILLPINDIVFSINLKSNVESWDANLESVFDRFLDSFEFSVSTR